MHRLNCIHRRKMGGNRGIVVGSLSASDSGPGYIIWWQLIHFAACFYCVVLTGFLFSCVLIVMGCEEPENWVRTSIASDDWTVNLGNEDLLMVEYSW